MFIFWERSIHFRVSTALVFFLFSPAFTVFDTDPCVQCAIYVYSRSKTLLPSTEKVSKLEKLQFCVPSLCVFSWRFVNNSSFWSKIRWTFSTSVTEIYTAGETLTKTLSCFLKVALILSHIMVLMPIFRIAKQQQQNKQTKTTTKKEEILTFSPIHWVNWAAACDFHQCGILTSVDSDEPVQPPFKHRTSKNVRSVELNTHRIWKALIRLRVCAGWSEALLVAHTTLLEISCRGSLMGIKQHYLLTIELPSSNTILIPCSVVSSAQRFHVLLKDDSGRLLCLVSGFVTSELVGLGAPSDSLPTEKFHVIFCWYFFQNQHFSKISFRNTIRVSKSLAPGQARRTIGPDLGSKHLQKL